jgi:hypothetical protein
VRALCTPFNYVSFHFSGWSLHIIFYGLREVDSLKQAKLVNCYIGELLEDTSITIWNDLVSEVLSKVNWLAILNEVRTKIIEIKYDRLSLLNP